MLITGKINEIVSKIPKKVHTKVQKKCPKNVRKSGPSKDAYVRFQNKLSLQLAPIVCLIHEMFDL